MATTPMWLCLGFPLLGLESCSDYRPDRPAALIRGREARQPVVALNASARQRGLQTDLSPTTLQALAPDLLLQQQDLDSEQQALQQLALWAWQYSPGIALYPGQLLLEIGSCLKLFGGAERMLASIGDDLAGLGYTVQYGLADTPLAARLLGQYGAGYEGCLPLLADPWQLASERVAAALGAIAIDDMLLEDKLRRDIPKRLRAAGIERIEQLRALPAAALGKRFGKAFEHYLGRLFGRRPDPQQGFEPAPIFELQRHCMEPIQGKPLLQRAMTALLPALQQYLRRRQLQTRHLYWRLHRHGGACQRIDVNSSLPGDDGSSFAALLELQLEHCQIPGEIISVSLHCEQFCDYSADTAGLFADLDNDAGPDIAELLDRLRPTTAAVYQLATADSHIPEQTQQRRRANPVADAALNRHAAKHADSRPLWMLRSPAPIQRRGRELFWRGPLELLGDPERITGNWWQRPVYRDYYVARGKNGELYWLFHDRLEQRWFLHGFF